jgi:hypothetical protein
MPVLIRCETTILNEQVTLDGQTGNIVKEYYASLTNGDTISITLDVSQGSIAFLILDSSGSVLLDKGNIGTEGWQGQWAAPSSDNFKFVVETAQGFAGQAAVHFTVTSATGSGGPQPAQQGGGFDPTPIVVAVVVLLAWFIFVLLIVRMRKQPPPPPAEGQPPPP